MNVKLIDKLDKIHAILAKSGLDSKTYKCVSAMLIDVKMELRGVKTKSEVSDKKLLAENCEHFQHDHCNCMGKYCLAQ